jgi:hypothetical protein
VRAGLEHYVPVPFKLALSGLPGPSSFTKTVAVRAPSFLGVKLTLTWHVAPGASSWEVQWLVPETAKSFGSAPPTVILETIKEAVPSFVIDISWGELFVPTL